jgi:N-acetylmuramic acid 6-phosphate (MurNAc-6-P) etherase
MDLLKRADGHVKVAIVMHKRGVAAEEARKLLERHEGKLREAIEEN